MMLPYALFAVLCTSRTADKQLMRPAVDGNDCSRSAANGCDMVRTNVEHRDVTEKSRPSRFPNSTWATVVGEAWRPPRPLFPPPMDGSTSPLGLGFDVSQLRSKPGEEYPQCVDRDRKCPWWAEIGECFKNPGFIIQGCPKSCGMCQVSLPKEIKCQRSGHPKPLLEAPGGLDRMFENIIANEAIKARYNTTIVSRDPWILTFQNFANPDDWEKLERMVQKFFQKSTVLIDGQFVQRRSKVRSSQNTFCMQPPCLNSPLHADLQNRLIDIIGTGTLAHMEDMQVLKYEEGQQYLNHHDYIKEQTHAMSGPRILTALVYFNEPDEGGETEFVKLGIKVVPKPGMMVLWPNTKNEDSLQKDERTSHQACRVKKGHKYAANLWVHLYDFMTPHLMGCSEGG